VLFMCSNKSNNNLFFIYWNNAVQLWMLLPCIFLLVKLDFFSSQFAMLYWALSLTSWLSADCAVSK
jgi:hypothetical protein